RQSAQAKGAENRRRLTQPNRLWRDYINPAGDPPPRPTSIGTAGRLRSEQVADINRNARPTSSESATGRGRARANQIYAAATASCHCAAASARKTLSVGRKMRWR